MIFQLPAPTLDAVIWTPTKPGVNMIFIISFRITLEISVFILLLVLTEGFNISSRVRREP